MAQTLKPIRLTRTHLSLQIDTNSFHSGYIEGLTNGTRRFDLSDSPTEQGIYEIVSNLIEIALEDGGINESWVRHDSGLIAGWLTRHEVKVK
jgi:hypothetical protein